MKKYSAIFFFLFTINSFSQKETVIDIFQVNLNNSYKISRVNIVPLSEIILVGNKLLKKEDYSINYSTGYFSLSAKVNYSLLDSIRISYQSIKVKLQREFKRRSLEIRYDDKLNDTVRVIKTSSAPLSIQNIFGNNLQKNGSLTRGFSLGTNKDFTLQSGLRLQLSGRISEDIELIAALSDENTPIQPDGNTETIDELDKVFIELKHKNASGTFGDYDLILQQNEFSRINKKLQGLKGEFNFETTKGLIAIAGSKGKFNTNQFTGQDGNQGPYRLYGINNERLIIVIAGSEKVYLDGVLMKRGENNDYIIDYSNSEITFSAKKLITSASRISIDFEYSDQQFKRNFLGTEFSTKIFSDKLKITAGYFKEGDDENSPIDFSLTEEQKKILENAGEDRNLALISGVSVAPLDSLGKTLGIYTKVDTTINSTAFTYYKYLPSKPSSIYNVSFTYVGQGEGDYIKESLGHYRFVGIKLGTYLPAIYLPMPQQKQLGNISLSYELLKGISISAEVSGSQWDKNKLSALDDAGNTGYAYKFNFDLQPLEIKINNQSIGKISFSAKDRLLQNKFTTLDRIDNVEFGRDYNINKNTNGDQILREIKFGYNPIDQLNFSTMYGFLKQGALQSNRYLLKSSFTSPQKLNADYSMDFVSTQNGSISSKWLRQNGSGAFNVWAFSSGLEFMMEERKEMFMNNDSLLSNSLNYFEVGPFIQFTPSASLDAKISIALREESFPLNGSMVKQSNALTQNYQLNFRGLKEYTSTLNITWRKKNFKEEFALLGMANNNTLLVQSTNRFNLWNGFINGDLFYQAATEQSARLEKVFVKVPIGTGNYVYLGDLNNNGIAEESEFSLTAYEGDFIVVTIPTDKLFPVIDLKLNTRWRIDFAKVFVSENILSSILKPISTETFWRIEENSKDLNTDNIYLLRLSTFLNGANTIRGFQLFQHDFNIFQNRTDLSFRLRYTQRKSSNQYAGGSEVGYLRERSLRIKFKMVDEIGNQTEVVNQTDNMDSPITTNRARKVEKNSFSSDFSYRPLQQIEVGFKVEAARSKDEYPIIPITVDMNSFVLRVNYSFENMGRLRVELERTELVATSSEYSIPYEITKGNMIGKNYFWRVFFDYKVASFVQTSLSYDARLQASNKVIHTMSAEARAFF